MSSSKGQAKAEGQLGDLGEAAVERIGAQGGGELVEATGAMDPATEPAARRRSSQALPSGPAVADLAFECVVDEETALVVDGEDDPSRWARR